MVSEALSCREVKAGGRAEEKNKNEEELWEKLIVDSYINHNLQLVPCYFHHLQERASGSGASREAFSGRKLCTLIPSGTDWFLGHGT